MAGITGSVVMALLSPFLSPVPAAPAQPPLLWTVLAWARREIQRSLFNHTPNAVVDSATTSEDTDTAIMVLANDTDADGDTLTVASYTQPTHGSVALNQGGTFTYTPESAYTGTDTFTYTVSDATGSRHIHGLAGLLFGGHTSTATVTVTVEGINHAPIAGNLYFNNVPIPGGSTLSSTAANDISDPDGDPLTASIVDQPQHGTVEFFPDGHFFYHAPTGYNGSDTFTYKVTDGTLDSNTATVYINNIVSPINHAPIAGNLYFNNVPIPGGSTLSSTAANDISDPDGDPLTASIVDQPQHGTVEFFPDGHFFYHAPTGYNGSDTFTYKVTDGTLDSNTATVYINNIVSPINHAPTAGDRTITIAENSALGASLALAVADVDGDPLTLELVRPPTYGTIGIFQPSGGFTYYTPGPDFNGTDTFTYRAFDGTDYSNVATVTINITPVNDAPNALDDNAATDEDHAVVISVLSNDSDVDQDPLTITAIGTASNGGHTVLNTDGTITYTPGTNAQALATGQQLIDTFTYTVSDGHGGVDNATVTVAVTGLNDAPTVTSGPTLGDPEVLSGAVLVTLTAGDIDGNNLGFSSNQATNGNVFFFGSNSGTAQFRFYPSRAALAAAAEPDAPSSAQFGNFDIIINDGQGAVISVPVSVPISTLNTVVVDVDLPNNVLGRDIGINPDGSSVYIGGRDGTLLVYDTATGTISAKVIGANVDKVEVSQADGRIYTGGGMGASSRGLTVIDPDSYEVITTIISAGVVDSLVISPDGGRVYTSGFGRDGVSVIDTSTYQVVTTMPTLADSITTAMAMSPDGTKVYVSSISPTESFVSVIDASSNTISATDASLADSPFAMTVSADGSRLYVANFRSDSVSVIDTASMTVLTEIPVGRNPLSLALSSDDGRLYVGNSANEDGTSSLSVVDTDSNAVVATLPVHNPYDLTMSTDGRRLYFIDSNYPYSLVAISVAPNTAV